MTFSHKHRSTVTLLPVVVLSIWIIIAGPCSAFADKQRNTLTVVQPYVSVHMPSVSDPRVPILEEEAFLGLHMGGLRSPILRRTLSSFRREVKMDSTGQNINFVEKLDKFDFRLPTYMSLKDYVETRRHRNQSDLWVRNALAKLGDQSGSQYGSGGALRIDIPVEIKNRAFQAIFGGGTVGLDVTGEINIRGGLRHENRSEVKTSLTRGSDTNFRMEQTQRFQVQGHIGEKVTIGVDQDSERAFDFENNLHLRYQGYEDEIIQSIEAGNIALSLPGTRFVTFGGQSSGLFGIKTSLNMGNLKLTAIASQEKGENKKLSLSGGATENSQKIEDYSYVKKQYYFLDEHYRSYFPQRSSDGLFIYDPARKVSQIEVYTSQPSFQNQPDRAIRGWAWTTNPKDTSTLIIKTRSDTIPSKNMYLGYFIRVEKTNYDFNPELGFIRLNNPLGSGEVLAVAYKDSAGYVRGQIDYDPKKDRNIQLRMLSSENPMPADVTWNLEWKNVYSLGGRSIPEDGFDLKIFFKPPSGDPQETVEVDGKVMSYLELFGLDKVDRVGNTKPDNVVDRNDNVLRLASGELWFPQLRPFDPDPAYNPSFPTDKRTRAIYDTTVQSFITAESKFYIEVQSKMRSAEYRLGMNIIENSEEVTLNGRRLNRGTDYTIDYFTGTLRMLNDEATRPTANVDVTYESNQMFQIDKKTVMGARAEYNLWDESFIGGTFLYLNERTLEQKVRVGKGPMRNMVWDVNSSMVMRPFFMTRFANLLPFVDTREPSTVRFEGEVAQVIPNPNTRNNEATGDNDGVAYIDDFEPAKRMTPLGISRRSWNLSSVPAEKMEYIPGTNWVDLSERGELQWWEPYEQYPIQEIWPNRDVTASTANHTSILKLRYIPPDSVSKKNESWGGIQKALSSGYWDQTESKFLEIWVHGDSGRMHIELGNISEDIIPNNELDTEDKMRNMIRNNVLDDDEDVGIDGMSDKDARAITAGADFWDINRNGRRDFGEPFSNDNWAYKEKSDNYAEINGMEGNANDYGGRRPDTEDMNNNGGLDRRNDYFSYSFSLSPNSPDAIYNVSTNYGLFNKTKWKLYRIPLAAGNDIMSKVGNPSITQISFVRIWLDGFSQPGEVWVADLNLVGNEWKELGIARPSLPEKYDLPADSTTGVFASVLNTHEDPEYIPPPGVSGEVDRITRARQREQALVMKIKNLGAGENGILQKTFFEPQDYINYRTLKMYVGGNDTRQRHISEDTTKIEFFLRFGADMNNYYEVREPVYPGWDKRNNIEVDLIELSAIKLIAENIDSTDGRKGYYKRFSNGKTYFIKGQPALRNIRMLVSGVRNLGKESFTGEIWLNELRLSNVKKDKGMALRARLDFDWADLLRFNGEINKQDADFHNVATRYGDGDNSFSGNFQASVNLDKFLPSKLGISLPFSYNYGRSQATPKYKPGTDVEVTDALPDSIIEQIRNVDEKRGFTVSFGIRSRSNNFVVKNILANLHANYSQSEGKGSNSTIKKSSSLAQSGNLDWGVNFSPNNYFRPFKFLGDSRLVMRLSDMKMYFTPANFNAKISGSRTLSEQMTRTKLFTSNNTFGVNSSIGTQMKVFESMSFDINRSYINDLQDIPNDTLRMMLNRGELGILTSMNQNFSARYNPRFFTWLNFNGSYSANFRYGFNRQQRLRDVSLGKNYNVSGTFDLNQLFKSVYKGAGPGAGRPRGQQQQRPRPQSGRSEPPPDQQDLSPREKAKQEKIKQEQERKVSERVMQARQVLAKQAAKGAAPDSALLRKAIEDSIAFKTKGVIKTDKQLKEEREQKERAEKERLARERADREVKEKQAKEKAELERKSKSKEQLQEEQRVTENLSQARKELLKELAQSGKADSTRLKAALADSVTLRGKKFKTLEEIAQEKKIRERLAQARAAIMKQLKRGAGADSSVLKAVLRDSAELATKGAKSTDRIEQEETIKRRLADARKKIIEDTKTVANKKAEQEKAIADSSRYRQRMLQSPDQIKMAQAIKSRLAKARKELANQIKKGGAADSTKLKAALADSILMRTPGYKTPERIAQEKKLRELLDQLRQELAARQRKGAKLDSSKLRLAVADSAYLQQTGRIKSSSQIKQEKRVRDRLARARKYIEQRTKKGKSFDGTELEAAKADSAQLYSTGKLRSLEQVNREQKTKVKLQNIREDLLKEMERLEESKSRLKTALADSVTLFTTGNLPGAKKSTPKAKDDRTKDKLNDEKKPFSAMGMVSKFFEMFEPVSVNYGKRDNIAMYGINGMPDWRFQLGLSDSLSMPQVSSTSSGSGGGSTVNRNSKSINNNLSLSTGFGLSRDIKIQFKFDDNYSLNSSTSTTGQRSHSRLVYNDLDLPFPEWSVRVSSLEKLPLLNKFVQRVSLDHNYNGQFDQTFNVDKGVEVITKDDRDAKFAPLVGFNLSFKNGMTISMRYNTSETVSLTKGFGDGATKMSRNDLSLTANYSKRGDFRIPLPVWPFKNMRLKNSVDLSVTFSLGSDVTMKKIGDGGYEVTNETSKWFFKPNLNYSFSDRVRGGAHIEVGKNHHKMLGDTSYKEFGIDVSISIRGG